MANLLSFLINTPGGMLSRKELHRTAITDEVIDMHHQQGDVVAAGKGGLASVMITAQGKTVSSGL